MRTLIFTSLSHMRPNQRKEIMDKYPGIVAQRDNLKDKSNWKDLSMVLKVIDGHKILHINAKDMSYNKLFEVFSKINLNKERLGHKFYVYLPNCLSKEASEVIVRSASKEINVEMR